MKLLNVYDCPAYSAVLLWQLLSEREPDQNISHKKMPTIGEHLAFIESIPYAHWYVVSADGNAVGAAYLSKQQEIGVAILKAYRGKGYGKQAVKSLMEAHPGKFLANINPRNSASARMFHQLGFVHIQNTYALEQA